MTDRAPIPISQIEAVMISERTQFRALLQLYRVKTQRCLFCLVAFLNIALFAADASAATPRRPNFIIVFCDNLGYGDIEPFGSEVHRTPHLNRMAQQGRKFTHFYVSAGVCTPSRSSLMTGCYSQRIGMHDNPRDGQVLRPVSPYGLNPAEQTIAEVLKDRGYRTALIGKWHLGDQHPFLPTRQGFDEFFGIPYSDDMTQAVGQRIGDRFEGNSWPPLPLMEAESVIEAPTDRNLLTKRYTERAIEFIRASGKRPFLLLLSHAMPGSTREPFASEEFRGKSQNGPWGDAVEELDWSTGQLMDALQEQGVANNTLIIWTSDNGSPGDPTTLARGTNRPLYGRGYTTSEGAFRVPTIAWWPGTVPAGSECPELATTMDLLPTFASLAGKPVDDPDRIDGKVITPLITGEEGATSPHEAFYYFDQGQLQAVRSGRYKLFLPLSSFGRHPHFKNNEPNTALLFDLVADTSCETNIAAQNPEVVADLTALAELARADLGDSSPDGSANRPGQGVRPRGEVPAPTARRLPGTYPDARTDADTN